MARDRRKRNGRRAGSFRTCVACRSKRPTEDLLRVVLSQDGEILPDLYGKLPGRGAHVCPDARCLQRAVSQNAFSRSFKHRVEKLDAHALLEAFYKSGLERIKSLLLSSARSGWLRSGRDETRASIKKNSASLVLLAQDASGKLRQQILHDAARTHVPVKRILTKSELGQFHKARPLAVLAITHRGIAKRLSREIDRVLSLFAGIETESGIGSDHNGLTGSEDRGMMPQTQASA